MSEIKRELHNFASHVVDELLELPVKYLNFIQNFQNSNNSKLVFICNCLVRKTRKHNQTCIKIIIIYHLNSIYILCLNI